MKQKPTLTIGIPVHNEEANIGNLLDSILRQKFSNFKLEKIIIIDDYSDDKTVEVVQTYKKKLPLIKIMRDKKRLGKCSRLNQIYKKNTSEILVTFDGDVVVAKNDALENIVKEFNDEKVALVSFNDLPVKPRTLAQKIVSAHYMLWNEIRKDFNQGNTVYNVHGNAQALRGSFANKVQYPKNITADQDFLYISAIRERKKLVHAKNAIVCFRTAGTLRDHFSQTSRFLNEKTGIEDYFGSWVRYIYHIPTTYKLNKAFIYFLKNPLYSFLAAVVYAQLIFFRKNYDPLNAKGMWTQASTTKAAIAITGHEFADFLML